MNLLVSSLESVSPYCAGLFTVFLKKLWLILYQIPRKISRA